MLDQNKRRVLELLRKAQFSAFGLSRATGIPFSVLKNTLMSLEAAGAVSHDGARYKVKEVANELSYES